MLSERVMETKASRGFLSAVPVNLDSSSFTRGLRYTAHGKIAESLLRGYINLT